MVKKQIGWRLDKDVWDILSAVTPRHRHLRTRLLKAFVFTLIVDVLASVAMYFMERDAPSTGLHSLGDSLYWTTAQLTTLSSPLKNPLTGVGRVITLLLDLYAITVVSTLAGVFSAFFHHRSDGHDHSASHAAS